MKGPKPRVVVFTATDVVSAADLRARLADLAALQAEARIAVAVVLRDPGLAAGALYELGAELRETTRALGARLLVRDRIDLAIALDADGVHLGARSVRVADARALVGERLVSVACHSLGDIVAAARAQADVAMLAPIFATPNKGPALGVSALTEARRALDAEGSELVLVALGGVDAGRARACIDAGASAVAAIRANPASLLHALGDA